MKDWTEYRKSLSQVPKKKYHVLMNIKNIDKKGDILKLDTILSNWLLNVLPAMIYEEEACIHICPID